MRAALEEFGTLAFDFEVMRPLVSMERGELQLGAWLAVVPDCYRGYCQVWAGGVVGSLQGHPICLEDDQPHTFNVRTVGDVCREILAKCTGEIRERGRRWFEETHATRLAHRESLKQWETEMKDGIPNLSNEELVDLLEDWARPGGEEILAAARAEILRRMGQR